MRGDHPERLQEGRPPLGLAQQLADHPHAGRTDELATSGSTPASCWTAVGGASPGSGWRSASLRASRRPTSRSICVGGVGDQAVVERLGLHGLHGLGDQIAVDAGLGLGDRRAQRAVHRLLRRDPGDGVGIDHIGVQQQHLQHALRPAGRDSVGQSLRRTPGRCRRPAAGPASGSSCRSGSCSRCPPRRPRRAGRPHRRSAAGPGAPASRRGCARPRTASSGSGEIAVRTRSPRSTASVPRILGRASSSGPSITVGTALTASSHIQRGRAATAPAGSRRSRRGTAGRSGPVATIGSTPYGCRPSRIAGQRAATADMTDPVVPDRRRSTVCRAACRGSARPGGVSISMASPQVVAHSEVLKAPARACSVSSAWARVATSAGSRPRAPAVTAPLAPAGRAVGAVSDGGPSGVRRLHSGRTMSVLLVGVPWGRNSAPSVKRWLRSSPSSRAAPSAADRPARTPKASTRSMF